MCPSPAPHIPWRPAISFNACQIPTRPSHKDGEIQGHKKIWSSEQGSVPLILCWDWVVSERRTFEIFICLLFIWAGWGEGRRGRGPGNDAQSQHRENQAKFVWVTFTVLFFYDKSSKCLLEKTRTTHKKCKKENKLSVLPQADTGFHILTSISQCAQCPHEWAVPSMSAHHAMSSAFSNSV